MVYICFDFYENILDGFKIYSGQDFHSKKLKGDASVKIVSRVTGCFFLHTLSDGGLYFLPSSMKICLMVLHLWSGHDFHKKNFGGV